MVLFDPTILEKSPYSSSPNISRSYLLSHLFETLIALRLARSENVAHFEEIISQLERCAGIRSLFDSANTLKQSFLLQLEENPSDPLLGDAGRTSTAR